jgi:uncharacterized HAD superfamily protein
MVGAKPIVIIDVDMVLADYVKRFVDDSRKLFKKPKKGYIQTHYYFTECGWTELEEKQIQAKQKAQPYFWRSIEKMPNTGDLRKRADALNLFFVTARFSTDGAPMIYQTADWLQDNYGIKDAYVISATKKGPVAIDLDADFAIDDKPQNCIEIAQALPSCKVYLQDAPYNADFKDKRIERIASINEFLKKVKR